jgi:hypothetical protein
MLGDIASFLAGKEPTASLPAVPRCLVLQALDGWDGSGYCWALSACTTAPKGLGDAGAAEREPACGRAETPSRADFGGLQTFFDGSELSFESIFGVRVSEC